MGTFFQEMRNGCLSKALENEPMFVLLGRDTSAPRMVRAWADQREAEIKAGQRPASDMDQVSEARDCARRMELWRAEHEGEWRNGRLPLDGPAKIAHGTGICGSAVVDIPDNRRGACRRYAGHAGPCEA